MKRSIYAKFLLILAPLFIGATALGGWRLIAHREAAAQQQFAVRIGGEVARTASLISQFDLAHDPASANQVISLLLFDPGIVCAEVKDGDSIVNDLRSPRMVGCEKANIAKFISVPIPDTQFDLRAGVSSDEIEQVRNDAMWTVVVLSALGLVYAAIAASIAFRWVIGRPVSKLLAGIRTSTEKGEHLTIAHGSSDEIGQLIDAFNAMQDRLRKEAQALRLAHADLRVQASIDPLTGLSNRASLSEHLEKMSSRLRERPTPAAALLIDLDDFKGVNDAYGHAIGDRVLQEAARRIKAAARPSDFVSRLGGDEFAILCEDLTSRAEAQAIAQGLSAIFAAPMRIESASLEIGLSVGVAFIEDLDVEPGELLRRADHAMYQAKRGGKRRFAIYAAAEAPDRHAIPAEPLRNSAA